MSETNQLVANIQRLNAVEKRIIDRFIQRKTMATEPGEVTLSFGDRVADRVTAFGGSWTFIVVTLAAISAWMAINGLQSKAFDPFPYILLNLVLACMTVLQAPLIMMSQNRQAARDRQDVQHDYEVNTKAELEVAGLHAKLDDIRDVQWTELMKLQQQQIALLTELASREAAARIGTDTARPIPTAEGAPSP